MYNTLKITYKDIVGKIMYIYNMTHINKYFNFVYYKNELSLIESTIELCISNYNNVRDYLTGIKPTLTVNDNLMFTIYE
jgi:hypothetical protein